MILNVDFGPTYLELAGLPTPAAMQGRSFAGQLSGESSDDWRQSMYYRYWMHKTHHNVYAHYGVRSHRYKLIYYYADAMGTEGSIDETYEPEWELFDLEVDPFELNNVVDEPAYADLAVELKAELHRQAEVGESAITWMWISTCRRDARRLQAEVGLGFTSAITCARCVD